SGFQTVTEGGKAAAGSADFEIFGVIREFSMNIGGRDEVSIVVETTLRDTRGGGILWSGAVAEKADRYAGVTGNTRSSIARYLSGALAKVTAKTRDAIGASIRQTYPERFDQAAAAAARDATPGVTVLVAPPGRMSASQAARPGMTGQLATTTIPARAKVYVGDVYYGLSPLKLALEPGIYTIHFKLVAFKTATEKVSVRQGETTELEIRLKR
ncbi:MAG: PEGA domain-containing protein, partial [Sulfuricaulis sp.]|nr:PEGA domain-containing protein [Sulfuricaulis sp.]